MKKTVFIFVVLFFVFAYPVLGQLVLAENDFTTSMGRWIPAAGNWEVIDRSLVQTNTKERMARIDLALPQVGVMEVKFDIAYVAGGYKDEEAYEKRSFHGGFGLHIGVKEAEIRGRAWGNDESYLLWLNLDTLPSTKNNFPQHYGFRAQVYESTTDIDMDLMEDYNVSLPLSWLKMKYLNSSVPVTLILNTKTGQIKLFDPTRSKPYYYEFFLEPEKMKGAYISLRTNSLSIRVDNFKASRLR